MYFTDYSFLLIPILNGIHTFYKAKPFYRNKKEQTFLPVLNFLGGEGFEPSKLSQQIYSLPPLAARESTHPYIKSESPVSFQNRIAYCHNQYSIERR